MYIRQYSTLFFLKKQEHIRCMQICTSCSAGQWTLTIFVVEKARVFIDANKCIHYRQRLTLNIFKGMTKREDGIHIPYTIRFDISRLFGGILWASKWQFAYICCGRVQSEAFHIQVFFLQRLVWLTLSERRPPNWQHKFLYFHYKLSVKLDVLCRQNKIWTFGNPFQSKKLPICA